MGIHQIGRVLGPQPQKGPPSVTTGHLTLPWAARRRRARAKATGPKPSTAQARNLSILQWSAEGVHNKKIAFVERLHEKIIEVACPQETPEKI